jgi:hypothetical protein
VPSMLLMSPSLHTNTTIIFYHTYMPPRFLLHRNSLAVDSAQTAVIDLTSAPASELNRNLEVVLRRYASEDVWLIAASSAPLPNTLCFDTEVSAADRCRFYGQQTLWLPNFSSEDPIPMKTCFATDGMRSAVRCAYDALSHLSLRTYRIINAKQSVRPALDASCLL